MKTYAKIDAKALRKTLGLSQSDFWSKVGITQSGGSRYENGRAMPAAVTELIRIVHIEKINTKNFNQIDQQIIEYIKIKETEYYNQLVKKLTSQAQIF